MLYFNGINFREIKFRGFFFRENLAKTCKIIGSRKLIQAKSIL